MPRRLPVLRPAFFTMFLLWSCHAGATQTDAAPYPNTEGFGVPFEKSEDWYRHCARVERPAPPPPPAAGKMRCDATNLYYQKRDQASTSAAEWRQVRACAEASGDDAVLMMLHANGYGTARDPDRAIYYACRLTTAKAEMEARIAYLASPAAASDSQSFDLCDHITSGRMGAVCADLSATRAERVRTARLDGVARTLPAAAQAPFFRLRKAAAAFAVQAQSEVDMQGTGAPGFAIAHVARRHDEFLRAVLDAAGGKLARTTPAGFARLDAQLNATYRKLLATPSAQEGWPDRIGQSTVTRSDVRSTERAWLAYRDAWGPFLATADMPADFVSIKALLTRQRIAQLGRI